MIISAWIGGAILISAAQSGGAIVQKNCPPVLHIEGKVQADARAT